MISLRRQPERETDVAKYTVKHIDSDNGGYTIDASDDYLIVSVEVDSDNYRQAGTINIRFADDNNPVTIKTAGNLSLFETIKVIDHLMKVQETEFLDEVFGEDHNLTITFEIE
jgi:hypothetical protein